MVGRLRHGRHWARLGVGVRPGRVAASERGWAREAVHGSDQGRQAAREREGGLVRLVGA